jgi:hypothetical protein
VGPSPDGRQHVVVRCDGEAIVCKFNNGWRWEPVAGSTSTPTSGGLQTQVRPPVTGDGSMASHEDSR